MSTTKTLNDRAEEQKEFHKKRQELIESDEFKKMLTEYEHWSKHLPILKAQIESVLGPLLEEQSVHSETVVPEKKGKPNRPIKPAGDVLKEMVALLRNHPKGMKGKDIAEKLNVGLPKIAEAISLNESLFEKREKGPKSVIQLKVPFTQN